MYETLFLDARHATDLLRPDILSIVLALRDIVNRFYGVF
jgi:hypothetical protein